IYWSLACVGGLGRLLTYASNTEIEDREVPHEILFCIYYVLAFGELIYHFVPDLKAKTVAEQRMVENEEEKIPLLKPVQETLPEGSGYAAELARIPIKQQCPQRSATAFSRFVFWWFTSLIIKGYKKPLQFEDLWPVRLEDSCYYIVPRFKKFWAAQLRKIKIIRREPTYKYSHNKSYQSNGYTPLDEQTHVMTAPDVDTATREKPNLLWVLVRAFSAEYVFVGGAIMLIVVIFQMFRPQLLQIILDLLEEEVFYSWQGVVLTLVLSFLSSLMTTLMMHHYHYGFHLGLKFRSCVMAIVFRKSLKLNSAARKGTTVGEIVNLMSVDAQRLQELPYLTHWIWAAPLFIALNVYYLWQILGPSAVAGLVLMGVVTPSNVLYFAKRVKALQVDQMLYKDKRIKLTNEVLSGIKVLKLYAWETSFDKEIAKIRELELGILKKIQFLNAMSAVTWFCTPYLVSFVCFAMFVYIDPNNVLDAQKAFVSLSYINTLNTPMSSLPNAITSLVQLIYFP
ncbi:unnamed protein product, partial [Owenia fusiformis]